MPEPNRAPWLIDPDLDGVSFARLIELNAVVGLGCHACRNSATWTAVELQHRFGHRPRLTFRDLVPRLRCGACKSEWVEVVRQDRSSARPATSP